MTLFQFLLTIHVAGGFTSLLLGLYVMIAKKGDTFHKKIGKIYFYALLSAAIVAIPMSYIHPNFFLFLISIFTIYMLLTGVRYLNKKDLSKVNHIDWAIAIVMLIFALIFIGLGIFYLTNGNNFGIVLVVFGAISLLFSYHDWRSFRGYSPIKNVYLTTHIQRMVGSYIASATAFLVVNNTFLPSVVAWLLPTVLVVPLIVIWTKKYKVMKNKA